MGLEKIATAALQSQLVLWVCSLIAAGLVGWLIARLFSSRAAVSWDCKQTEIDCRPGDDQLQMMYKGEPVPRASVAEIRLVNTGNQVIREEPDLDSPLRVCAPRGSRLLRAEAVEQACEGVGVECRPVSATEAEIHFRALKPREHVLISVVHDGPPDEEPAVRGQLAEASIRRARPARNRWLIAAAAGAMIVALAAGGTDLFLYWKSQGPERWHRLAFGLAMLAGAALALSGLVYLIRGRDQ